MQSPNNLIFQATTALFDEHMFSHCPDTMDQGHTCVDKYNLPEENILLEDGDGPQDVPDLWVPPNVPNQEGPNYHQPLYRNTAPPDTPPDYSHQSLMYHTPSRSKSPGEKEKHGADNTSHERSEEAQDTWHP